MSRKNNSLSSATSSLGPRACSELELLRRNQLLARELSIARLKLREQRNQSSSQVLLRMVQADIKATFDFINVELRQEMHRSVEQHIDNILNGLRERIHHLPNSLLSEALQEKVDDNVIHRNLLDEEQRSLHRQSSLERIRVKFGSNNDLSTIAEVSRGRISDLQVTDEITESLMTTIRRTISIGTHTDEEIKNQQQPVFPLTSTPVESPEPKVQEPPPKPKKIGKKKKTVETPAQKRELRTRCKEVNYKE